MKKVLLIVLDGCGVRESEESNAVKIADTPNLDSLLERYPSTTLKASGEAVGLPPRTLGGSEVGHLHMGAGRIVKQKLTQINDSIEDGRFFEKPQLREAMENCKRNNSSLHIMGLLSDAGIHSNINHLFAVIEAAERHSLEDLKIHCFLDGRDTPPRVAEKYIDMLEDRMEETGVGEIVTISGRFYSMDRDERWKRTQMAFDAIVKGKGLKSDTATDGLKEAYDRDEGDEFVKPTVIDDYKGLDSDDSVFLFNFRADRMRQITKYLLEVNRNIVSMTEYSEELDTEVMFPPTFVEDTLGEVISREDVKQLRIAESEKGPHVTYFFNGQREGAFRGEKRIIPPSPKVDTYDKTPAMSAREVTDRLVEELKKDYGFVLLNFANGDMVGHTGDLEAAVKGVEAVDECLGRILDAANGWTLMVTADHGNCENMEEGMETAHTFNEVPFILVDDELKDRKLKKGGLVNVAPTVLEVMGTQKPDEMEDVPSLIGSC